jgi:hypothetical protein
VGDHRFGVVEAGGVAGLGQDRGGANHRQPPDGGHQLGQVEFGQRLGHAALDLGQRRQRLLEVGQHQRASLQRPGPLGLDPAVVAGGGIQRPQDA